MYLDMVSYSCINQNNMARLNSFCKNNQIVKMKIRLSDNMLCITNNLIWCVSFVVYSDY